MRSTGNPKVLAPTGLRPTRRVKVENRKLELEVENTFNGAWTSKKNLAVSEPPRALVGGFGFGAAHRCAFATSNWLSQGARRRSEGPQVIG